jgi:putative ABC transport system permease protein
VIDSVEARLAGLEIGDAVDIAGSSLKVTGIAEGNNVVFAQIAFISEEEARAEFQRAISDAHLPSVPAGLDPKTNINVMLVTTEPGKAAGVAAGINKHVPGVNAFVARDFSDNSKRALKQAIVPILLIILALGFLVGTLVLGLTVYTGVLEKEREFGVIKALGAPAPAVLRVVLEQAVVCCGLGFGVGMVATLIATRVVTLAVPQFLTSVRLSDVVLVFAGTLAMSVFASLVPVVRVMKVDTLSVFKA